MVTKHLVYYIFITCVVFILAIACIVSVLHGKIMADSGYTGKHIIVQAVSFFEGTPVVVDLINLNSSDIYTFNVTNNGEILFQSMFSFVNHTRFIFTALTTGFLDAKNYLCLFNSSQLIDSISLTVVELSGMI